MNNPESKNDDKVYILDADTKKCHEVSHEIVQEYVAFICDKMKMNHLDVNLVVKNVFPKLKKINTEQEFEDQIIMTATEMITDHYDYPNIAIYLLISNLHRNTDDDYFEVVKKLRANVNKKGKPAPIVSKSFAKYVEKHRDEINAALNYDRDYGIPIFGYRTLERAYLKKTVNGKIVERPQHMYMRVAIALHYRTHRLDKIIETYNLLSQGYFTHATPTLFNAGTKREQLSSCFLLGIDDDMLEIGECWKRCALISKYSGGIGIHMTNLRVSGAYIHSTQGMASGMRVTKVFNEIARYADQGGKRAGSIAIYIEPWHGDIFFFLELKKNTGAETDRARDLFLALMVNDIFMQRVEADGIWSLMCPHSCPELLNKYGEEFTRTYEKYEREGNFLRQLPAREVFFKIMESQIETGVPYIVYKDAVNYKSNQINIGVVNGSNLCSEIVQVSNTNEVAVCNLASICLPKFIEHNDTGLSYNYQKLYEVARVACRNLNNIIDINYYPVEQARISNLKHRPIGIGVQGLADVYAMFKTPFDSELARDMNRKIFETIYYGAMTESMEMAREQRPYETYHGSPFSKGRFQMDLWKLDYTRLSGMWDWEALREKIKIYGVRNSLTTTCMPTASTSQIQGWNECLAGDTKIYSPCGLTKYIRDFEENDFVVGWNNQKLENSVCYEKINKGEKNTIKLTFEDGRNIICTPDHKLLTYEKKWIEAKDININTKIMAGIDGTYDKNYKDEENYVLKAGDYTFNMKNNENRNKILAFARIIGYIMADGNIYFNKVNNQYQISLYMGTKYDTNCIVYDIESIQKIKPYVNDNGRVFVIRLNASFVKAIMSLDGIIVGKRLTQEAKMPSFLMADDCPKSIIREFLAGHFGGDGQAPSLSKPSRGISTLRGIKLAHSIHKDYVNSMIKFMNDINYLMMKLGMPSSVISPPQKVHSKLSNKDSVVIRLSVPSGPEFMELIGFRYCGDKMLKLTVANIYWNYKNNIYKQRNEIFDNAIKYIGDGLTKHQALKKARNEFIEYNNIISDVSLGTTESFRKYYYHNVTKGNHPQRINLDISVIDFFKNLDCLHWFDQEKYVLDRNESELPYFSLKLINKTQGPKTNVWDINVKYNHSFIANGVVVHNCIEPYTENIYTRSTLAGDFYVINRHLMKDLMDLGLWNEDTVDLIKYYEGSIQQIDGIPDNIKQIYRTVWEIPQKSILEMSADRAPFIDQTQSLNIFIAKPDFRKLTSAHFTGWKLGLKTGMYYLRSKASSEANQFGIDIDKINRIKAKQKNNDEEKIMICPMRPKGWKPGDDCDCCSG